MITKTETRYQELFGSPEAVADYIIDYCESDCYACPFYEFPCFKSFQASEEHREKIVEYLMEEQ